MPWPTVTVPKFEIVNVGAKTPSVIEVEAVRLPEVPVIVTVLVPMLAELAAVSVSVELPVAGFGENEAVTPVGKPVTDRLTFPVKPYCEIT